MLSQHLITKPVFDALFAGHDFATHNPVSQVMQTMLDALDGTGLDAETSRLEKFYDSVRLRAAAGRQRRGQAAAHHRALREVLQDRLQEAVRGPRHRLHAGRDRRLHPPRRRPGPARSSSGRGLTDEGVHVLDPFTGTGTFIVRLLQSGLITPADLARKYAKELHANEILLLAYYIAAVNIETTYHALTGKTADTDDYEPFDGIVLTDTFQINEADDTLDPEVFPANNDRITAELRTPVSVILGNPPYSVGQTSANDLNANVKYPTLDSRIAQTYVALSTATLKRSLYDSYVRAFRWATDRLPEDGVVAFVSNGGWIDDNTADGIRLSLADEYSKLYVYNLRGDQRGDWQLEGGKIFGEGAQTAVAIWIGVRSAAHVGPCEIFYRDIGDSLSRQEKLAIVAEATMDSIEWQRITPDSHGDWLSQRSTTFVQWPAIGGKEGKDPVFRSYSLGLSTNRDKWVYNFSRTRLMESVERLAKNFNAQQDPFWRVPGE